MHPRGAPQQALSLFPSQEVTFYECGRDLFTFVTVASSHIMRTLQRPKKSRPTKRKVNHRRFLQNQICRKYADIEAATQQLATSILSQEAEAEKRPEALETPGQPCPTTTRIACSVALEKEPSLPPCDTENVSASPLKLPIVAENSTFLGVAEAFFVPDAGSALGVTIDNLAYGPDEADTAENLFVDIRDSEEMGPPACAFFTPLNQSLSGITQNSLQQEVPGLPQQDGGFVLCRKNLVAWVPEARDVTILQLPDFPLLRSARHMDTCRVTDHSLYPASTTTLPCTLLPERMIDPLTVHSNGEAYFQDTSRTSSHQTLNRQSISELSPSHHQRNDCCLQTDDSSWQACLGSPYFAEMDAFFSAHNGDIILDNELRAGIGRSSEELANDGFFFLSPSTDPQMLSTTKSVRSNSLFYDDHLSVGSW